jgi:hypothetical protein
MTYYVGTHQSQYGSGCSSYTRRYGCTWTTVVNLIINVTKGRKHPSPDYVHSLVARREETTPRTPGWSIPDAVKASARYARRSGRDEVRLIERTGIGFAGVHGWNGIKLALSRGRYVMLSGDSDRFGNNTCSGAFNGNHMIGINPRTRIHNGRRQHLINDPICRQWRWEYDAIIYSYGHKLALATGKPLQWGCSKGRVPTV